MRKALRSVASQVRRALESPEHGASAVEYGLLIALVAAVIFGAVATLGEGLLADLTAFVSSWP